MVESASHLYKDLLQYLADGYPDSVQVARYHPKETIPLRVVAPTTLRPSPDSASIWLPGGPAPQTLILNPTVTQGNLAPL